MDTFKERIYLGEAAYPNNVGFAEMVKFYQTAKPAELKAMEMVIKGEDWEAFKALIQKVLKVKLK
jgi:hypothetical protein